MKKLVVFSSIVVIMGTLAIFELVYFGNLYSEIECELVVVSEQLELDEFVVAEQKLCSLCEKWKENEALIYLFSNHNSANRLYENMLLARTYATYKDKEDALAYTTLSLQLARGSSSDLHLFLYNVF